MGDTVTDERRALVGIRYDGGMACAHELRPYRIKVTTRPLVRTLATQVFIPVWVVSSRRGDVPSISALVCHTKRCRGTMCAHAPELR